jgi:hypothetical protein
MTPEQRRQLEMCAKACGIEGEYRTIGICAQRWDSPFWNPLADTDAGRSQCAVMCAELGIDTITNYFLNYNGVLCDDSHYNTQHEPYHNHPSRTAAWQAAACAVAAAIGEAM